VNKIDLPLSKIEQVAFLEKLRTGVANYFLRKKVTKNNRERNIFNLRDAKTIGIIFNSASAEDVDLVKKYDSYLRDMGKTVKTMGYVGLKEPAINISWWPGEAYITREEINWLYEPKEQFIHSFVQEGFDMLIDLNVNGEMPLMFVTASSKAKCKVGRYTERYSNLYDVMIETDETKTLKYFLRNVDTYMEMLNKGRNVETAKH